MGKLTGIMTGEIVVYSLCSAGGDRQGGDEVHESQLRELGGEFLSVWEKLLSWLVACKAWGGGVETLDIVYFR